MTFRWTRAHGNRWRVEREDVRRERERVEMLNEWLAAHPWKASLLVGQGKSADV